MKKIEVNGNEYELIVNYKNGFDADEFNICYTEFFEDYDFIVGDIAYGKLRLKGFYASDNNKVKRINNYDYLDEYIRDYCAIDCKYYVLKKIKSDG